MMHFVSNINGVLVTADYDIQPDEAAAYVKRGREQRPDATLEAIDIEILEDGEYVDIRYHYAKAPFQRLRRVTGYLAGDLSRFNDAKRAEERDRVKHGVM